MHYINKIEPLPEFDNNVEKKLSEMNISKDNVNIIFTQAGAGSRYLVENFSLKEHRDAYEFDIQEALKDEESIKNIISKLKDKKTSLFADIKEEKIGDNFDFFKRLNDVIKEADTYIFIAVYKRAFPVDRFETYSLLDNMNSEQINAKIASLVKS